MFANKAETEKQPDENIARLQKDVKLFKLMKYQKVNNDGAQGKPPRYPLRARSLHND